jgi:hypothetical protein
MAAEGQGLTTASNGGVSCVFPIFGWDGLEGASIVEEGAGLNRKHVHPDGGLPDSPEPVAPGKAGFCEELFQLRCTAPFWDCQCGGEAPMQTLRDQRRRPTEPARKRRSKLQQRPLAIRQRWRRSPRGRQ